MTVQVYIVSEPLAIDFIQNEDLDGFKEYLDSDDTLLFPEPEEFATKAEALAYCSGIGYGSDERSPVESVIRSVAARSATSRSSMPSKIIEVLTILISGMLKFRSPGILPLLRLPKSQKILLTL